MLQAWTAKILDSTVRGARSIGSAATTIRRAFDGETGKTTAQRLILQESARQRFSNFQQQFDRFGRLKTAYDSG